MNIFYTVLHYLTNYFPSSTASNKIMDSGSSDLIEIQITVVKFNFFFTN